MTIRPATAVDAEVLVELRAVMFEAMGRSGVQQQDWRASAETWFRRTLTGGDAACFVAETLDGQLVAAALGEIISQPPSPSNPQGLAGRVSNVVTLPDHRRRGHARACVERLLAWFQADTAVADIDLFATGNGSQLYDSLGFRVRPYPAMRLHLHR